MLWVIAVVLFFVIIVILFLLNFYRDPERQVPKGNNIVSPADGRVISIIDTSKGSVKVSKGYFGKIRTLTKDIAKETYVISIFMSPLDAHKNRSPIEGKIVSMNHTKGRFFKAYDLEKSLENEKNEIIIQNKAMKIKVIQIAGFLARRIILYVKVNEKVNKGQKIGMITLGSQATLIIPKKLVELRVRLNDKVRAGESIIAEIGVQDE
ncbi:MAG TPA: phosphatidylserine decarboxylase [Candidatus Nanoarchaeia archaeon]|nr:phosphatidylserine decarboxylase [Candidatus Nanoarchaeia archaeon]